MPARTSSATTTTGTTTATAVLPAVPSPLELLVPSLPLPEFDSAAAEDEAAADEAAAPVLDAVTIAVVEGVLAVVTMTVTALV